MSCSCLFLPIEDLSRAAMHALRVLLKHEQNCLELTKGEASGSRSRSEIAAAALEEIGISRLLHLQPNTARPLTATLLQQLLHHTFAVGSVAAVARDEEGFELYCAYMDTAADGSFVSPPLVVEAAAAAAAAAAAPAEKSAAAAAAALTAAEDYQLKEADRKELLLQAQQLTAFLHFAVSPQLQGKTDAYLLGWLWQQEQERHNTREEKEEETPMAASVQQHEAQQQPERKELLLLQHLSHIVYDRSAAIAQQLHADFRQHLQQQDWRCSSSECNLLGGEGCGRNAAAERMSLNVRAGEGVYVLGLRSLSNPKERLLLPGEGSEISSVSVGLVLLRGRLP
ncbi:hypothetical protein cyc_07674 [Cyclospora cayetanensis]|uniref:Uncharacterized protein n=1 Tax=Cyclospora cayetanensis TaxID=88456 RepID=A0A1D3D5W5_9EIME|nr:hypothetical protein cyc_07674 [Cyclospora cayetanensis]